MNVANGGEVVGQAAEGGGGEEGNRAAARLPRWSRQEILVLIQGKRVAESRVRRGRAAGGLGQGQGQGQVQVESKWASVSSYCKRHGVSRGPVQCRKRWSNLAGDYKKIKEWESQITREDTTESFWVMRNDLRRERKLPGFFDREVYDILDNGTSPSSSVTPTPLLFPLAPPSQPQDEDDHLNNNNNNKQDDEAVFDSGRNGLFSDFAQSAQEEAAGSPEKEFTKTLPAPVPIPIPISEKQYQPFSQGATHGTQQTSNPEVGATTSHEGRKRRRFGVDGDEETNTLQCQLIEVLEKNGKMLCAQLEAQNTNFQLDREQRKDHTGSLVTVLNKLADALGRIADKL